MLAGFLGMGVLLMGVDRLVGTRQAQVLEDKATTKMSLEKMAWYYLRADILDVAYTADGRYRFTVWMENVFPEHDLYVMMPTPRIFVQVGPQWSEVPAFEATANPALSQGTVVSLKDKLTVNWIMEVPPGLDYFELLEGYMHVQLQNTMLISPEAEPKEHIVERNDYYYVHLKPIGADDDYLSKVHHFPGKIPIYIPMPPH